jgi:ribosomal protein S18 acetylase RimI-like enzyme
MTGASYDPTLWFVAYDGDEIAGYALCKPQEGGDPKLGWVDVLGVRRPWRRRGLALALLLHAFGEFRSRGHARVGLGVDTENTTGAVGLYEKAGMRPVRQFDAYEKPR